MLETAIQVALQMSLRSEDPDTQVGAVAMTADNRIIATAYNGLLPGYTLCQLWTRDEKLLHMVHAEQNLCSLIRRNEAMRAVITHQPCPSCLLLLACHGIREITYVYQYGRSHDESVMIGRFYNLSIFRWQGVA